MDVDYILFMLDSKDLAKGYEALQEAERLSQESDGLYPYCGRFAAMTKSGKSFLRIRGFRLLCKQARWDAAGAINQPLTAALSILQDEKPTVVRQALAALLEVLPYKGELLGAIREAALQINPYRYKDTMHSLLAGDVNRLLGVMQSQSASHTGKE